MDEYYQELQEELQTFDKYFYFNKNHFLKRIFQLVLSVSIFSLILCYSSGFSFFPHSFNVYFSTFLFTFFTHALQRKYMFLICNGIVAFLSKSSVSCSHTSSSSASTAAEVLSASAFAASPSSVDNVAEVEVHDVAHQQAEEKGCLFEEEKGIETGVFMEEAEEEEEENDFVVIQEDDITDAEAEAVNEPTTDELNKKIEEFIRKMKEEIRVEAQQQLVAV